MAVARCRSSSWCWIYSCSASINDLLLASTTAGAHGALEEVVGQVECPGAGHLGIPPGELRTTGQGATRVRSASRDLAKLGLLDTFRT